MVDHSKRQHTKEKSPKEAIKSARRSGGAKPGGKTSSPNKDDARYSKLRK